MDNVSSLSSNNTCFGLHRNGLYVFATLLYTVLSTVSLYMSIVVFWIVHRCVLFHPNVKLLMRTVSLCLALIAVCTFFKGCYYIAQTVFSFHANGIGNLMCLLIETPTAILLNVFVVALFAIGVDRFLATLNYSWRHKIEQDETSTVVMKCFVVLLWFNGLVTQSIYVHKSFRSPSAEYALCFCSMVFLTGYQNLITFTLITLTIKLLTLALFGYVFYISKTLYLKFSINTAAHNLQERFQLSNTIKATTTLLPFLITHAVFNSCFLIIFFILTQTGAIKNDVSGINLTICFYIVASIDITFAPFWWIKYNDNLKYLAVKHFSVMKYLMKKPMLNSKCNKIYSYKVDYRVKPEEANDILQVIWSTKNF